MSKLQLTPRPLTEADITKQIRKFLIFKRIFHFKAWQGLGSTKGVADIIGCINGRFLAIEVKRENGKLSDHQETFLENVRRSGGIAFVARSINDCIDNLKEYW